MQVIPVQTLKQAEQLRRVRNDCRLFMTHNTNVITQVQQRRWFSTLDRQKYSPFLVLDDQGCPAGYCLVAMIDGVPWLTGGLYGAYRGQGMGRLIFQWMIDWCVERGHQTIMLDVQRTNDRGRTLYESLGFIHVDETPEVHIMRYTAP